MGIVHPKDGLLMLLRGDSDEKEVLPHSMSIIG
jgi:hypothetical protein